MRTTYSYAFERRYYGAEWPAEPKPYAHLGRWLRCWLDPETIFRGRRMLDLGAGECTYARLIAGAFDPAHVVACDLYPERMRPAASVSLEPKLRFVAGDAFALPFRTGAIDLVWGGAILSQLPELDRALREVARVLRPGGRYVGWEPNPFNPVVAYRSLCRPRSRNEYLFWPWRFRGAFARAGFSLSFRYFYARLPRARSPLLGTCVGLTAERMSAR